MLYSRVLQSLTMEEKDHIDALDGFRLLKVADQQSSFPKHYQETFCISFIESGLEAIQMGDGTLITEKGAISINNPLEVHSNPLLDPHISTSFTTFYLSPDLVEHLRGEKDVQYAHQQTPDPEHIRLFGNVIQAVEDADIQLLELNLGQLLKRFTKLPLADSDTIRQLDTKWRELMQLIDQSLEKKVTLDQLAYFMSMSKYHFAKEFRTKNGLSPMNYVLMKKVFKAKELISRTTHLTQLAYQFGFFDQAHFSRQFKRFVGVSPREFQSQLL